MTAEEIEKIKMAGYIAFGQDLRLGDNPEKPGTPEYNAWRLGWNKADDEDSIIEPEDPEDDNPNGNYFDDTEDW